MDAAILLNQRIAPMPMPMPMLHPLARRSVQRGLDPIGRADA
jgi:hypothetical protein